MSAILAFLRDTDGTTAVEYAVLLALILISIIGAIQSVGGQSGGMWGGVQTSLQDQAFSAVP